MDDLTEFPISNKSRIMKRVSFAETKHIKEFLRGHEHAWGEAYDQEVTVSSSSSLELTETLPSTVLLSETETNMEIEEDTMSICQEKETKSATEKIEASAFSSNLYRLFGLPTENNFGSQSINPSDNDVPSNSFSFKNMKTEDEKNNEPYDFPSFKSHSENCPEDETIKLPTDLELTYVANCSNLMPHTEIKSNLRSSKNDRDHTIDEKDLLIYNQTYVGEQDVEFTCEQNFLPKNNNETCCAELDIEEDQTNFNLTTSMPVNFKNSITNFTEFSNRLPSDMEMTEVIRSKTELYSQKGEADKITTAKSWDGINCSNIMNVPLNEMSFNNHANKQTNLSAKDTSRILVDTNTSTLSQSMILRDRTNISPCDMEITKHFNQKVPLNVYPDEENCPHFDSIEANLLNTLTSRNTICNSLPQSIDLTKNMLNKVTENYKRSSVDRLTSRATCNGSLVVNEKTSIIPVDIEITESISPTLLVDPASGNVAMEKSMLNFEEMTCAKLQDMEVTKNIFQIVVYDKKDNGVSSAELHVNSGVYQNLDEKTCTVPQDIEILSLRASAENLCAEENYTIGSDGFDANFVEEANSNLQKDPVNEIQLKNHYNVQHSEVMHCSNNFVSNTSFVPVIDKQQQKEVKLDSHCEQNSLDKSNYMNAYECMNSSSSNKCTILQEKNTSNAVEMHTVDLVANNTISVVNENISIIDNQCSEDIPLEVDKISNPPEISYVAVDNVINSTVNNTLKNISTVQDNLTETMPSENASINDPILYQSNDDVMQPDSEPAELSKCNELIHLHGSSDTVSASKNNVTEVEESSFQAVNQSAIKMCSTDGIRNVSMKNCSIYQVNTKSDTVKSSVISSGSLTEEPKSEGCSVTLNSLQPEEIETKIIANCVLNQSLLSPQLNSSNLINNSRINHTTGFNKSNSMTGIELDVPITPIKDKSSDVKLMECKAFNFSNVCVPLETNEVADISVANISDQSDGSILSLDSSITLDFVNVNCNVSLNCNRMSKRMRLDESSVLHENLKVISPTVSRHSISELDSEIITYDEAIPGENICLSCHKMDISLMDVNGTLFQVDLNENSSVLTLTDKPIRIYLEFELDPDEFHFIIKAASYTPRCQDLTKAPAILAMNTFSDGLNKEISNLIGVHICQLESRLLPITNMFNVMMNFLMEMNLVKSCYPTKFIGNRIETSLYFSSTRTLIEIEFSVNKAEKERPLKPLISVVPNIVFGNARKAALILAISECHSEQNFLWSVFEAVHVIVTGTIK